jgi:hypothetical protein
MRPARPVLVCSAPWSSGGSIVRWWRRGWCRSGRAIGSRPTVVAQTELREPMPVAHPVEARVRAGAHQITRRLQLGRRHMDRRQQPAREQAREFARVTTRGSSGWSARSARRPTNTHVRRLLVESAWHARRRPTVGYQLARRQRGQDAVVIERAWRCQKRSTSAGNGWPAAANRSRRSSSPAPRARRLRLGRSQPTSRSGPSERTNPLGLEQRMCPTTRRTLATSMRHQPRPVTRDARPRQLPTVTSHAVPTGECQSDPPSLPRTIRCSRPRANPSTRAGPLDSLLHVRGLMWNCGGCGDGTDQAAEFERPQFVLVVRVARGSDAPRLGRHPQLTQSHIRPLVGD